MTLALVSWQNQAFAEFFDLHFQNDVSKTRTMLYVLIVSEELEAWQDAIQGRLYNNTYILWNMNEPRIDNSDNFSLSNFPLNTYPCGRQVPPR